MQYLSLLALALASLATAEPFNKDFSVNLLTRDESTSIGLANQTPVSWNNATIKHNYNGIIYSVVGSMIINDTNQVQSFRIDNDQWSVDVSYPESIEGCAYIDHQINMSMAKAGGDLDTHQDVEIGKQEGQSTSFWFTELPNKVTNVDFNMPQENYKAVEVASV
jgi:hypothetical protein